MAFKLHPQEWSPGPVISPGAVEWSVKPSCWLGRYLEIAVNKSGELLCFEQYGQNCSSFLSVDDLNQQAAESVLGVRLMP